MLTDTVEISAEEMRAFIRSRRAQRIAQRLPNGNNVYKDYRDGKVSGGHKMEGCQKEPATVDFDQRADRP